jgi:cytochrome c
MKLFRSLVVTLLLGASALVSAQERGTKEEAKALADAAAAHVQKVGAEKASKDFMQDKAAWTKKDLYVFMYDMKGNCLANGANNSLVGKNLIDMKDQNGKPIIAEFTKTVQTNGTGWVDYEWAHPQTKKVEGKTSYIAKAGEGYVGVGAYR